MSEFRTFLELSYAELEDLNLQAKEQRKKRVAADVIQEERLRYLTDERRAGLMLGSVSLRVLSAARRPVAIVPSTASSRKRAH